MWELWSDETRVVVYSKYTTTEGVATEREREYTYSNTSLSPPPYSISTRPDWTQMHHETQQERVQQRKEWSTHHKQQKMDRFKNTKTKITKRVRIVIRWNSSCRIFKNHNSDIRRGHREGERVHLLLCIFVTAPVFQLDTSWLNTDAPSNTAREGATTKRKTNPPQTTKKITVSKTQNINNKTGENCDPMKLELSYIQNTQQRKARPQRGREEYTYYHP